MARPAAKHERGYALLTVLFLGAVMAIMLALSLPRAAFEAQRGKEEDLIYRGGQYSRAVQLYFRKFRRYPARLEDLEKTNSVRFLRKKYIDPVTKKEDWRFIHIGPAGIFTDSLVYDKPQKKKEGEPGSAESSSPPGPETGPGLGVTGPQPITGMADRLRASVSSGGPNPGAEGSPDPGGSPTSGPPAYFNAPQPSYGAPPATYPVGGYPPGYPASSGGAFPGSPAALPGAGFPGGPGSPPRQPGPPSYPGQPIPGGFPTAGGFGSSGTPGMGSEAAKLIQQILTTPRPGGLAGIQGPGQPSAFGAQGGAFTGAPGGSSFGGASTSAFGSSGGATFGGGIAGVASKSEARGIKVFQEREVYNEWEFVYDYRRDTSLMGAMPGMSGMPGTTGGFSGQPGAGPHSTGFGGTPSPFGPQQPGYGPGGFGQTPFGQPGAVPINPMQPGLSTSPFGPRPRPAPQGR